MFLNLTAHDNPFGVLIKMITFICMRSLPSAYKHAVILLILKQKKTGFLPLPLVYVIKSKKFHDFPKGDTRMKVKSEHQNWVSLYSSSLTTLRAE